jgi:hypothetical protein
MRLLTAAVLMAAGATLTHAGFPATAQEHMQSPKLSDEVPNTCPVTKPSDHPFVPPAAYPSVGALWIGSEKLWTNITADGIWSPSPHYTPEDSRLGEKLFWWHEGYDWRTENPPHLTVTGERLDAPAPPITMDGHANAGWTNDRDHAFIIVGIFIPTVGCWKVTGEYEGEELSYVVWVSDSRQSVDSSECSTNDLLALIKPDDPAYADAIELAQTLQGHGVIVKCVLQSKMVHVFEDQKGAAFFKTDYGDFNALFLPKPQTFSSVEIVSRSENGRFLYSFRGSPHPASPYPIDSAYRMFFEKHANQLFITSKSQLAASIAKALS